MKPLYCLSISRIQRASAANSPGTTTPEDVSTAGDETSSGRNAENGGRRDFGGRGCRQSGFQYTYGQRSSSTELFNETPLKHHVYGVMISMHDYYPRGPSFDSRLYPRNFSGNIVSRTWSIQLREDNWAAT